MKAPLVSCASLLFVGHLFPYVCFLDADGYIQLWKVFSYREFCQRVGVCVIKTKAKTIDEARNYLPLKQSKPKPYPEQKEYLFTPGI